jgi:hypothetical protein
MHGFAKVDADVRLLARIWPRKLIDWTRLTFWSWFG